MSKGHCMKFWNVSTGGEHPKPKGTFVCIWYIDGRSSISQANYTLLSPLLRFLPLLGLISLLVYLMVYSLLFGVHYSHTKMVKIKLTRAISHEARK